MDNITDFLYLIGSVFAPMIAVQIADYFILKKENSRQYAARYVGGHFIMYDGRWAGKENK